MGKKCLLSIILVFLASPLGATDSFEIHGSNEFILSYPDTGSTVFPLLERPLGGRSQGMGRAYSAVPLDFGSLTSNPASTALLPQTELALTHHKEIAETNIEGFAFTRRFGRLGIGAAMQYLHTPYILYDPWEDAIGKTRISEGVAILNTSYNFFSNYYFHGISLGMNLKGAFRVVPTAFNDYQSLTALVADIGLLSRFNFLKPYASSERNLTLGATVKNLGLVSGNKALLSVFSAGIAYSPLPSLLLSFDYNRPFTLKPETPYKNWYLAGGANLNLTDSLSLQAGFLYDRANPAATMGGVLDLRRFSILMNYTLEINTENEAFSRFGLEVKVNMGDEGRRELQRKVAAHYLAGLESYIKDEVVTARRHWEAALALDPTFQPAREYLETLAEALNIYEQIEELNSLR